jgi:PAS domain-containing protein
MLPQAGWRVIMTESVFGFSILVGLLFACVVGLAMFKAATRPPIIRPVPDPEVALLFRDGALVDADDQLWPLIGTGSDKTPSWPDVRTALTTLVPDLPETCPTLAGDLPHSTGPRVSVSIHADQTRVSLRPERDMHNAWFEARQNEVTVAQLCPALAHSPNPIWSIDDAGHFLWGNDAFHRLADQHDGPGAFSAHISDLMETPDIPRSNRVSLNSDTKRQDRWFEVVTRKTDGVVLHFATGVDAVVRAEEAQRNFVQTLSKTFANLTTGLAIFDRNRRLALFNPALIDLSGLSAEFLSSRPNLFAFFDKLREQQVMPEPKNYDNWRERMARLVAAASDDRFRETWNLAGGQTFDVTGRPYPDGAIAFLINDITAEVSLTRGFRTELETMQSTLDAMEDAVAVFNRQGVLTVSNAAYKTMWSVDPDTCLTDVSILDATQEWKSAFHPNPIWPELRDYVTGATERASWDGDLRSKDGREVICRVDPICYGATMIRFCLATSRRQSPGDSDTLKIVSA